MTKLRRATQQPLNLDPPIVIQLADVGRSTAVNMGSLSRSFVDFVHSRPGF
jgi:hypothetical protein